MLFALEIDKVHRDAFVIKSKLAFIIYQDC